jgi:Mg-chelatase subunit ChlD
VKIIAKNGSDLRPKDGDFVTTTLVELTPDNKLGRIPANIVFLIDASSSMGGDKWSMVKQAVAEIVEVLKDDDRVSIVLFGSQAKEVFPLASLAENRKTMRDSITQLENPSGVTNLEQGLKMAFAAFDKRSQADKNKRVNHVLLLTDGFPTDDQGYRMEKTNKYEEIVGKHENVTLTGIGIGSADDYDSTFINRLSELGRGSYYHANDLAKFKEGMQAEIQKLQSSVVGELILKFSDMGSKIMRIAKIAPEIVVYDVPGNAKGFELKTGSMTKDLTAFLVQVSSKGDGNVGSDLELYSLEGVADGNGTEKVKVSIKSTDREADLSNVDPDVFRAIQALQVHLNGAQIRESIDSGDKAKATRLIENTAKIASNLGQDKVTRALGQLASDIKQGKSVSDNLATIQDESKKTRLLVR